LTGLPSFVTHNRATADFTIPQIYDLSIVGDYKVHIRSEIYIPNDYTLQSYTTKFTEYDFFIRIKLLNQIAITASAMID